MSPAEIRASRIALGITQGQAARLCGVDRRTWRRYEAPERPTGARGGHPMHEPVQRLLRLLALPGVREWLEEMNTHAADPESVQDGSGVLG